MIKILFRVLMFGKPEHAECDVTGGKPRNYHEIVLT